VVDMAWLSGSVSSCLASCQAVHVLDTCCGVGMLLVEMAMVTPVCTGCNVLLNFWEPSSDMYDVHRLHGEAYTSGREITTCHMCVTMRHMCVTYCVDQRREV